MKKEAKHLNQEKENYLKNNFINEFSGKTTTVSTNPVFILKHIEGAYQTHLCLLSSHA